MQHPIVTPADRLIVAADLTLHPGEHPKLLRKRLHAFMWALRNTGVCIKLNAEVPAFGYLELAHDLHRMGLEVFLDLKINDIPQTMARHGALLQWYKPRFVTAMCSAGEDGLRALKQSLPDTYVLGVTVFTSMSERTCDHVYARPVQAAVEALAAEAYAGGVDGFVCAPTEVALLRELYGTEYIHVTPGVRPTWACVTGDDQNQERVMSPGDAIRAGANAVVVGRPITQAPDPREAVLRTLDEIEEALAA